MDEIRIGIIGCGFMGRTNAETVTRYLKHARLVAVAGGSRAPELATVYGVACEPTVGSLLAREDIDAAFISTPHSMHAAQAIEAAEHGKHILLDKPMATSVEECDRIIETARRARVNLMIMFTQRFRICNREAYRLISDGAIGRITMIQGSMLNSGGIASLPPWQSRSENLGTFFAHGVHAIDQVRWFTGDEIATVTALVQRDSAKGNESSAMALLGLRGGAMATLWESWTIPSPGFPNTGFSARVAGETGIIDVDGYGTLRLGRNGIWQIVAEQPPIDWKGQGMLDANRMEAYALQGQEFVNSIREGSRPSITGEDGRAAVAVALAAYQSAGESRTITLGPL